MSAPSQWVKLITSGPLTPGKKYLLPPEKPATSCGKTGPTITIWSYSCTIRFTRTSTSIAISPFESRPVSSAVMVPAVTNVSGRSQRWLKIPTPA